MTHHPNSDLELVVGLSGGKDSTALALRLAEIEPADYSYIINPTGDELPEMVAHWNNLECLLGKPMTRVTSGLSFREMCERENMLPNHWARFCTRILKIEPTQAWIDQRAAEGKRVILHIGLRADEEGRDGAEYKNCEVRFPFREWGWGLAEVMGYLFERGVPIPERTDCARCFWQTLPEWWYLHRDHRELFDDAAAQERKAGHTFRSPGRDTWPASLYELGAEFDRGRMPRGLNPTESFLGFSANKCRTCTL